MKEKLLALLKEQYEIIKRNLPDTDDSDNFDKDGEEIFDEGRLQGRYEICRMIEKIIDE